MILASQYTRVADRQTDDRQHLIGKTELAMQLQRSAKMIPLLLVRFIIILLSLAQSCLWLNSVATLTSVFSGTKSVESSANLMSSLCLDNVFKCCAKTRNNVGPEHEPRTKPRLNDSNFQTSPLKRQTCWRGDRNDPIQL